jgi:hypothetical protein
MRTLGRAVWVMGCLFLVAASPLKASDDVCGSTEVELLRNQAQAPFAASDSVVTVRVVFVTFPNAQDSLPAWRNDFISDFDDYIRTMSYGKQRFNISVATRPAASALAWEVSQADTEYSFYGDVNREVMLQIRDSLGSAVWDSAELVVMIHYRNRIGYAGISGLGCEPCGVGYTGRGTTQALYNNQFDGLYSQKAMEWVAAHEYGHVLGFVGHTPGSDPRFFSGPNLVNPGRYDQMMAIASYAQLLGFVPYHALNLSLAGGPRWLSPREVIAVDTLGLRVPDIRGSDPAFFEVGRAEGGQSFLLVNHQTGSSPYDAKYDSSGLYIWHMLGTRADRLPLGALDLESADGKYDQPPCAATDYSAPDPVSGRDRLENCNSHTGSFLDAFDGVTKTIMACGTNPSTSLYDPGLQYSNPQAKRTSIAFENIRRDGSDMLVDVYVTPKQFLLEPNGGEALQVGVPDTIRWKVRGSACITTVNLYLTTAGVGGRIDTVAIASGLANSGQYVWTPTVLQAGPMKRILVESRDEAGGLGRDASDNEFVVHPEDITAPCAVGLGLIMGKTTAVLFWSAGGDDCNSGTALAYELRMSLAPITEGNFISAALLSAGPAANPPSCFQVVGLVPCRTYYFAIRHVDDAGNFSPITVRSGDTYCSGGWEAQCFTGAPSARLQPGVEMPRALEFARPAPNPAGDEVRLEYGIPRHFDGGTLEVKVFDLSGREIRTVTKGLASPGRHTLTWDLRSNAAARVGAGLYFLKLRAGQQEIKRSVLVLR